MLRCLTFFDVRLTIFNRILQMQSTMNVRYMHFSCVYTVMQSDGNSFLGDVVLASRNENNISGQVCKSKYVRITFMIFLIPKNIIRKMLNNTTITLKPNSISSLLCFFKYAFSFVTFEIKNLHNLRKIFPFHTLGLKNVFIPVWHVKGVKDDISVKNCPIWLHHPA